MPRKKVHALKLQVVSIVIYIRAAQKRISERIAVQNKESSAMNEIAFGFFGLFENSHFTVLLLLHAYTAVHDVIRGKWCVHSLCNNFYDSEYFMVSLTRRGHLFRL